MVGRFDWFENRRRRKGAVEGWRQFIMRTARDPHPYAEGWVNDTMEGRSQMVALVTTIILRRLRAVIARDAKLSRTLYHAVFKSFDAALREEGVGDASIARRMRKIGEEFVGLARAFDGALDNAAPGEVEDVLARNGVCSAPHSAPLAAWLSDLQSHLAELSEDDLIHGRVTPKTRSDALR